MKSTALRPVTDPRVQRAHKIDLHVGARVRQRRKDLKISQQELARHLNLTFQQVQKYERGANRISASKLFETAEVLEVSVSFFFAGYQDQNSTAQKMSHIEEFLMSPDGIELGKCFLNIQSPEQRKRVLDLMRAIGTGN